MIKYAFMSFSCPDLSLEDMLALAKLYGYDGVEPRAQARHAHGLEMEADAGTRRDAAQKASESGIALCCVATSCRYSDPDTAQQNVEDTLRCIDLAADVGAPRIRVFGGQIAEGISRERAIENLVASLRAVADHAASRGVTVCVVRAPRIAFSAIDADYCSTTERLHPRRLLSAKVLSSVHRSTVRREL